MPPKYSLPQAILESQQLNPLEQMSMFAPAVYDMMSLAPVSSDPRKERKQTELDAKTRSMTTQTSFADPQVLSRLIEATNPFKAQKMGILNQYDTLKEDLKRPVQTDLSPLLAMADRMSGGATLKAYDRPQNSGELMDRIRSHLVGIQKSRNEYQDNLTNQINSIKAGQTQQLSEALLKTMAGTQLLGNTSQVAQDRMRAQGIRDIQKSYARETEPYEKVYSSARVITDLAKSGNALNKKNLETLLFNLRGDRGAPSNYDTMGTAENQGLVEKLQQKYATITGEGLDEENAKLVLDIAKRYKSAASETLRRLRNQSKQRAEAAYGHIGITGKDLRLGGPDIQEKLAKIEKYKSWLSKTEKPDPSTTPEQIKALNEKRANVMKIVQSLQSQVKDE